MSRMEYILPDNGKQRLGWIDMMRGICMFLVILHHSGAPELYQRFLSPFFLSGFFFISGYLFLNPQKSFDGKLKFIRVVETLLIPYFLYATLTYFVKALYVEVWQQGHWNIFISYFEELLLGKKLWFMSVLVVCEVALTAFLSVSRKPMWIATFTVGVAVLWCGTSLSSGKFYPWYLGQACIALLFMSAGIGARIYGQMLQVVMKKSVAITLGMVYLSWVALDYHYHLTHIMFASNCFEPLWLFLLVALVGVMALAGIVSHLPNFSWLTALGRNTLVFYFFSNQVIMLVFSQVEKLQIGNYYISSWLVAAVSSLLLAIPVVVCNKYLPWMAGKCTIISKRYSL